jgi:glycosyltransferase involved in cell wall biosynthesis
VKVRNVIEGGAPRLMPALRAMSRTAGKAQEQFTALIRTLFLTPERGFPTWAIRREVQRVLARVLTRDFDVIQVEQSEAAHWLAGATRGGTKVLVLHDVNSTIARRRMELEQSLPGRMAARLEWMKMCRYERRMADLCQNCIVVSEEEKRSLQALQTVARIWVVPNGVDARYFTVDPSAPIAPDSLVFTGTMCWEPNVDAIMFFCEQVLPIIRARRPAVTLHVVGAEPSEKVRRLAERNRVIVTGEVPDVRPYLERASVCVVPLRFGAGTRLKILEALAMGKAVVSTSVGCEGLGLSHGREILIADSPETFADAVCQLLEDQAQRGRLGALGRKLVEGQYDWRVIACQQDTVYRELLESRAPSAEG